MTKNVFDKLLSSDQFREELFVAQTQARLAQILEEKGVCRAELARRLDVTRARVTQIFSDDAKNLTLRLLVRSYLALGEEPLVIPRSEYEALKAKKPTGVSAGSPHTQEAVDGLTEAVIANLLRATIGERAIDGERPKRSEDAKAWAALGTNVVPLRRRAHG